MPKTKRQFHQNNQDIQKLYCTCYDMLYSQKPIFFKRVVKRCSV